MRYSILILFTGYISFVSCKKERPAASAVTQPPPPPPPPPPQGKTIKVRVVEYGSEIPIAGAVVSVCTSPVSWPVCTGSNTYITTNNNGEAFFSTDRYLFFTALKDGYFDHILLCISCFVQFLGPDSAGGAYQAIHTADSVIVKIVPKTDFTLHIVDSSLRGPLDGNYLAMRAEFGHVSAGMGDIRLRKGIDTTVQLQSMYGNVTYDFKVGYEYDDGGMSLMNIIYETQKYVSKGLNPILKITY